MLNLARWRSAGRVICCAAGVVSVAVAFAQGHKITVFVEEGRHSLTGHVFLSLSDSKKTSYHGFYSKNKLGAPAAMGGGQVRDDSKTDWDVKRTYTIDKMDYKKALAAISAWSREDKAWWVNHHCGDFVETVLEAAGINLPLEWTYTGKNRPGLFGRYLREHGGVARYPFEGDWIVVSSDFLPTGAQARVDRENGGYRVVGSGYLFRGTGSTVSDNHVLTMAELKLQLPDMPLEILAMALGQLSSRADLELSEQGQTLELRITGDRLMVKKTYDDAGNVIESRFDKVEKGAVRMRAILSRAAP